MALDALSTAVYHDMAKPVQRPVTETNVVQDSAAMTIKVNEIPAPAKSTGNGQETGQEKSFKENMASEQQIRSAISKANNKLRTHKTSIEFSYHEETKRVSIKVTDKETQEVIREIPPEETLEMIQKMWELAGILIDERR